MPAQGSNRLVRVDVVLVAGDCSVSGKYWDLGPV